MAATGAQILLAARRRQKKIRSPPNQVYPAEASFIAQTGLNDGPTTAWIADYNNAYNAKVGAIAQPNPSIVPNSGGVCSLGNLPLFGAADNPGLLAAYVSSLSPNVAATRRVYREMVDDARSIDGDGRLLAEAFLGFPTKVGGQYINHHFMNSVENSSQDLHWVVDTKWGLPAMVGADRVVGRFQPGTNFYDKIYGGGINGYNLYESEAQFLFSIHDVFAAIAFPDAPARIYHYVADPGCPLFFPKKTKVHTNVLPPDDDTVDDGFTRLDGMNCWIANFGYVCTLMIFLGLHHVQYPIINSNPRADKVVATDAFGNPLFGGKLFNLSIGVIGGADAVTLLSHNICLWSYDRLFAAVHAAGLLDHTTYMLQFNATQPGVAMVNANCTGLKGIDKDITARGFAYSHLSRTLRVRILAQLRYPLFRQIQAPVINDPLLVVYRSHPTSLEKVQVVGGGRGFFNSLIGFHSRLHTQLTKLTTKSATELAKSPEFDGLKRAIVTYIKMGGIVADDPSRTLVYELVTTVPAPGRLGVYVSHSEFFKLPQRFEEHLINLLMRCFVATTRRFASPYVTSFPSFPETPQRTKNSGAPGI